MTSVSTWSAFIAATLLGMVQAQNAWATPAPELVVETPLGSDESRPFGSEMSGPFDSGDFTTPVYEPGKPLPAGMLPPPEYRYEPGTLLPEGYHIEERPKRGLVISGTIVTAVPWGTGLLVGAGSRFANGSYYLVLPVLGPWLALGFDDKSQCNLFEPRPENVSRSRCDWQVAGDALLLSDGILQGIGGMLLIMGYSFTSEYAVRDGFSYAVSPALVGSGYGLTAFGTL